MDMKTYKYITNLKQYNSTLSIQHFSPRVGGTDMKSISDNNYYQGISTCKAGKQSWKQKISIQNTRITTQSYQI